MLALGNLSCALIPGTAFAQTPFATTTATVNPIERTHFDIFTGNNKPGPYTLSWDNLRISRDEKFVVVVDGENLKPTEYTLDAKKGVITFAKPLKTTSVARVSYYYDAKLSKRNSGVSSAPVTVPLLRFGGTDLQVTALPNNDSSKSGFSAPLAFSAGKTMNLAGGGLTSKFNYAGSDALGMQLGYKYGNQNNGFEGNFYRADKKLIERFGNKLGYTDAARSWNLASRLTPAKWLGVTFNSNEGTDLKQNIQKGQNVLNLRVGGVGSMPLLGVSRTEDMTVDAKHNETSVTTDKVDMSLRVSPGTDLAMSGVKVTTDVPSEKGDVVDENRTFVLNSASKDNKTKATLAFTDGEKETAGATEDRNGFSLRLQAAPSFVIGAEKRDVVTTPLKSDGTDGTPTATMTQTFSAEIVPIPFTKLTGQLTETATNDIPVSVTVVTAQYGIGQSFEVTTGRTNRSSDAPGADPLNTTLATIAYRPAKGVTMTGGFTWNPEQQGRVSQAYRQEFGLTAKSGAWEVGSGYTITTLNGVTDWDKVDPQYGQFSLNLGLKLSKYSRVTGTYTDSLLYRSADSLPANLVPRYTRILGFGLTHATGPGFNLTLATTVIENRANVKQPTDKKIEGKIGVLF